MMTLRRAEPPSAPGRASRRRAPRWGGSAAVFALLLALPLSALLSPGVSARLQTAAEGLQAFPKPFTIDLTQVPTERQQFNMGENFPAGEYPIDIKGDGKKWWLVQFEKVPPGISFRVRDKVNGYARAQPLPQGVWFPIRTNLPVLMIIGQTTNASPVSFRVKVGSLDEQAQGEVQQYEPQAVQKYVDTPEYYRHVKEAGLSTIELHYGQMSVVPLGSPTPSPAQPSPTPAATEAGGIGSYWVYSVPFLILMLIAAIVLFVKSRDGHRGDQNPRRKERRPDGQGVITIGDTSGGGRLSRLFGGRGRAKQPPPEPPPHNMTTNTAPVDAQPKEALKAATPEPGGNVGQPVHGLTTNELKIITDSLAHRIDNLKAELSGKANSDAAEIYDLLRPSLLDEIRLAKNELRGEIQAQKTQFETSLGELAGTLRGEIKAGDGDVMREAGGVKSRVEALEGAHRGLNEAFTKVAEEQGELAARLAGLEQRGGVERAGELHSAKVLGRVLEENVDVLREGNFGAFMGELKERLNRFFREEVGRDGDDSLRGLQQKADAISEAFHEAVTTFSALNPDGGGEARGLVERVDATAAEMRKLGGQLAAQQLDIAATVHIPVSAHARARRTFLEELGLAVQREVAKLSDPLMHFENEMERLATSEVVGLADVCDRRFPPGTKPELEERLKKLFTLAGVEDIVPAPLAPFETGRQELLGMVDGRPQDSLRVAQVLSRGFTYKQDGAQTLLRKAGVKVYR